MNTKISITSLVFFVALVVLADSAQAQQGFPGSANRQNTRYGQQRQYQGAQQGGVRGQPQTQYQNVKLTDAQKQKSTIGAVFYDTQAGIAVRTVYANSPAQKVGLNSNEMITKLNGQTVKNSAALTSAIEGMSAGDTFRLTKRSFVGKESDITCTVATMAQVFEASIVPEAGVYDEAVVKAEVMMKQMAIKIRNAEMELEASKKEYAAMQKRTEELKAKAVEERKKVEAMKEAAK